MRTLSKVLWPLILLLSIVWMVGGAVITSDVVADGQVGGDLENRIGALAANSSIDALASVPLPLLFLISGLPFTLVSLVMLWRKRRALTANAAADPKPNYRRQTIIVTALALLFALALWNIRDIEGALRQTGLRADPVDDLVLTHIIYPARLFVTFVHEAGHSLAALLSGGQVLGFTVSPDGSGLAVTSGGDQALILPAGYLGAALFGATLFLLANRIPRWTRALSGIIGLSFITLTILYARPDAGGNLTALFVGIGYGVGLLALGWGAPRIINLFFLNALAILTGLHALMDLLTLARNPEMGNQLNDAAKFSEYSPLGIAPGFVAAVWAACAVIMLLAAMYFGLIKPAGRELNDAVRA